MKPGINSLGQKMGLLFGFVWVCSSRVPLFSIQIGFVPFNNLLLQNSILPPMLRVPEAGHVRLRCAPPLPSPSLSVPWLNHDSKL
jgi:hypothetical protein